MAVSRATRRQLAGLCGLTAVLAAVTVAFSPTAVLDSLEELSATPVVFVGVAFGLYLVRPFLLWPLTVLSVTVGFVLGVAYGLPVALAGALLTETIPFLFARHVRTGAGILGFASRTGDRFVRTTGQFRGVVAARLSPIPSDVVSTAAGLSDVSLRSYLLGSLVGEAPWVVAGVLAGASMHTLTVQGLSHSLALFAGAGSLSVLLLVGPVYRHVSGERGPASPSD